MYSWFYQCVHLWCSEDWRHQSHIQLPNSFIAAVSYLWLNDRSLEQVASVENGPGDWRKLSQRWWPGSRSLSRREDSSVSLTEEGEGLSPACGSGASMVLSWLPKSQGRKPPPFSGSPGILLLWLQAPPEAPLGEPLACSPFHWEQPKGSRWVFLPYIWAQVLT